MLGSLQWSYVLGEVFEIPTFPPPHNIFNEEEFTKTTMMIFAVRMLN
jgi:hypothetical protein